MNRGGWEPAESPGCHQQRRREGAGSGEPGLMLTGSFVISPMLIVLLLFAKDFVTMTIAIDRLQPAPKPRRWAVRRLVGAAGVFAALSLLFSMARCRLNGALLCYRYC